MLRTHLPEPVYVAVVRSITGLLPSKLTGIIVVVAQASYLSYRLDDAAITAATLFTALVAIPRIATMALWNTRRDTIADGRSAARWEAALAAANLPTAFGIGLITAATIAHGDADWSMVEIAVAVGFVSTYIAAAGVRPAVGTAHFVAVMCPALLACLWHGGTSYLVLAGLAAFLVQTWREYQRASYNALVAQITLEQAAEVSARKDPLTGLANRLAFMERLCALNAGEMPFTLMLLDLDGFKRINDTWGHRAGDAVLIEIAERVQRRLSDSETAFRLGGDEFAVLAMRATPQELASRLIEDCRVPVQRDDFSLRVGASIGAAAGPDTQVERVADEALYAAKAAGKNCWRMASALAVAA